MYPFVDVYIPIITMHWVRNIPCSYFTGKESGTQGDLMAHPGCPAGKSGRQDSNPRPADPKALALGPPCSAASYSLFLRTGDPLEEMSQKGASGKGVELC